MFALATTRSKSPAATETADAQSSDVTAAPRVTRLRVGLALLIALIWAVGASAEVTLPNNHLMFMFPGADKAGPPPIVKPGLRLTYWGGSASIPGSYQQLVHNAQGDWENKQTGKKFKAEDMNGSAGEGYGVVRVGYVDQKIVALSTTNYLLDRSTNKVSSTGGSGMLAHAGCASDYWVNPTILRKIQPMNQNGVVIVRMVYPLNGKRYNAIRFQTTGASGYTMYMYDLDSGLMIAHGMRTQGKGVVKPGAFGQAQTGAGYTHITNGFIVDVEQVNVPWANAQTPAWVSQLKQLHYQGGYRTFLAGVGNFDRQMQLTINVKDRGNGWIRTVADSTMTLQGYPPIKGQQQNTFAHASMGGLWIPPQALAQLRPGQVLDTNKITHTKMVVTGVGQGYVQLSEIGDEHRNDAAYAMNTGVLTGLIIKQQMGQSINTTQLKLVGQR